MASGVSSESGKVTEENIEVQAPPNMSLVIKGMDGAEISKKDSYKNESNKSDYETESLMNVNGATTKNSSSNA